MFEYLCRTLCGVWDTDSVTEVRGRGVSVRGMGGLMTLYTLLHY